MKKYFISLLFLSIVLGTFAQNRSIKFETSNWDQILKKAKAENKLIMLDAFTSWCGPCKWMAKNTFTNDTVADFYNKKFINAGIDWEKGEGLVLSKKYIVKGYPTLLFIDGDGNEVHRGYGASGPKDFVAIGKLALSPEKRDNAMKQQYEASKNDKKFLKKYLEVISKSSSVDTKKVLSQYFSLLNENEKLEKENMEILLSNIRDAGNSESLIFKKNYDTFCKAFGQEYCTPALKSIYSFQAASIARNPNGTEQQYKDLTNELETFKFSFRDTLKAGMDMQYYNQKKDWNNYFLASQKYFETVGKEDYNLMNAAAWNIYEKSDKKEFLEGALVWSKKSVALKKDEWAFFDTYACLLYKVDKKKEALQAAEEAVRLAQMDKLAESDYVETVNLINKIKKEIQ